MVYFSFFYFLANIQVNADSSNTSANLPLLRSFAVFKTLILVFILSFSVILTLFSVVVYTILGHSFFIFSISPFTLFFAIFYGILIV